MKFGIVLFVGVVAISTDSVRKELEQEKAQLSFQACIEEALSRTRKKKQNDEFDSLKNAGCDGEGLVSGTLLRGLVDAGLLAASEIKFSGDSLTATLNVERAYGELPTKSKVPVGWVVDQEFTLTRSEPGKVSVTGLHTLPSKEALQIYREAMGQASRCEEKDLIVESEDEIPACIDAEMKQVGEKMQDKKFQKNFLYATRHNKQKISQIMKVSYENWGIWGGVKAGPGGWNKVFYSLVTAAPLTITEFKFDAKLGVAATAVLYEPSYLPDEDRKDLKRLYNIANIMSVKSIKDAGSTMAVAEKAARSGMALAKMFVFGNEKIRNALGDGLGWGNLNAVANMFSRCRKLANAEERTTSSSCESSDLGRVSWAKALGVTMT